jgi:hypothetical protein
MIDTMAAATVPSVDFSNADTSRGCCNQPADIKGKLWLLLGHIHLGPCD